MDKDKFKRQIESIWKHRDTDEQKRLLKFGIAKTMRLTLTYPKLAQEYYDSLCKVISDNERITVSNYHHNLTSDAEGEEMLCVSRAKLLDAFNSAKIIANSKMSSKMLAGAANMCINTFKDLFGSKCLPDNVDSLDSNVDSSHSNVDSLEPKPAEPKFNLGDIVRFKYCCTTYRIDGFKMSDGVMLYQVGEVWAEESDLEPYTEPKENIAETRNLSQDRDKLFDNILKNSFSKERRLNIAAQMMQGLICAPPIPGVDPHPPAEYLAQTAFRLADALIAEAEK